MRITIRHLLLPAAVLALALIVPSQASASLAVQRDCADSDVFEKKHTRAELNATLRDIQADLGEYSECKRMILAALARLDKTGKSTIGGGARIAQLDTDGDGIVEPAEKRAAAKRAKKQRERQDKKLAGVGDGLTQDDASAAPGAADDSDGGGGGGGSSGSSLALILALAALACGGIGGGVWYAAKRNPDFATALRRVPLPFRNS